MGVMSRFNAHNVRGADHLPGWCSICGRPHPERHHVVARSLGGSSGPMIHLCGCGNNLFDADRRILHHGLAEHHRLWFWWLDGTDADLQPDTPPLVHLPCWIYLISDHPISEMEALREKDWRAIW